MAMNIPVHFVQSYSTNVQMLLQAKGGKLRPYVTLGNYVGMAASPVEQIGQVAATRITNRDGDTSYTQPDDERRWVFPVDYDVAQLISRQDRLRLLIDPTSAYTMNTVTALRRAEDQEILLGFFGTAYTGVNYGTQTAYNTNATTASPPGMQVAVGFGAVGSVGMTVAKIKEARRSLRRAHVDLEDARICCAITSSEESQLLAEIQVIHADYNGGKPVLEDGKLVRYLGVDFVCMEFTDATAYPYAASSMQSTDTTINYCPIWVDQGMHLGTWNDVETSVDTLPTKRYATQVYGKGTFGACRIQEKMVHQIACLHL